MKLPTASDGRATELEFDYKGYQCEIVRIMELGHLCGYVRVPKHLSINPDEIRVHYGFTFDETKDEWRTLGFDCAHYGDLIPQIVSLRKGWGKSKSNDRETYKTVAYVKAQLEAVVDQLPPL